MIVRLEVRIFLWEETAWETAAGVNPAGRVPFYMCAADRKVAEWVSMPVTEKDWVPVTVPSGYE